MNKTIIIAVLTIMTLAMAGTAMARGGQYRNIDGGCGFNGGPQIFNQLTPAKQLEVETIFNKYEGKLQTLRNQMWAKRTELNALVASGNADKTTISTLVNEMSTLRESNYTLRNQISSEIEQATGIVMPAGGFRGYDMNNGRRGSGRPHHNARQGGCLNF